VRAEDLYSDRPARVDWEFADGILFDSEHVRELFHRSFGAPQASAVASESLDPREYFFREHRPSLSIAWAGPLTSEGNPFLLGQIVEMLATRHPSYRISVPVGTADLRALDYLDHALRTRGLSENVVREDVGEGVDRWLEDKDYVLSTGITNASVRTVLVGMAKGLKPVVHDWAGAATVLPGEALFTRADEAVRLIASSRLRSEDYRSYVARRHSEGSERQTIEDLLLLHPLAK